MIFVNRFYLIESLPDNERKTGKELYDDCLSIVLKRGKGIKVDYISVSNKSELIEILREILNETEKGYIPIIHFEMHGFLTDNEFGFILGSGERVLIYEIKDIITNININTKNHLFITVSACFGAAIFSLSLPTERSPFQAILGPKYSATAALLLHGYHEFYTTLFLEMDGDKALGAARQIFEAQGGQLLFISSKSYFKEIFKNFEENHTGNNPNESREKKVAFFNKLRDNFFMFDIHPENSQEINISYEDIENLQ